MGGSEQPVASDLRSVQTREASPGSATQVRTQFPNNQIPASMFSTFAKQMAPFGEVGAPNRGGSPGDFRLRPQQLHHHQRHHHQSHRQGSVKLDHAINDKQRLALFASVTANRQEVGPGGPPGLPLPLWNGQVTTSTPRRIAALTPGRLRRACSTASRSGLTISPKDALSPNADGRVEGQGLPEARDRLRRELSVRIFFRYTGWGSSADNGTFQPLVSIKNDLSYFRGKHNFKFGYNFDAQHANGFGQQTIGGSVAFNRNGTAVPGFHHFQPDQWRQFVRFVPPGLGERFIHRNGAATFPSVIPYHGFYAQDDWRVTRKLNINFGLRYDMTLPPVAEERQVCRLHAGPPESGGEQLSRRVAVRRVRSRAARGRAAWCRAGTAAGVRGSASPTRPIRRPASVRLSAAPSAGSRWCGSSGHYDGFARIYTNGTPDSGITPAFLVDAGPSIPYVLPPVIDPTHQQQQRRAFLAAAGRGAGAGDRSTGPFDPAAAYAEYRRGSGLQRDDRHAPADRQRQHQPGVDAGVHGVCGTLRRDRRARPLQCRH